MYYTLPSPSLCINLNVHAVSSASSSSLDITGRSKGLSIEEWGSFPGWTSCKISLSLSFEVYSFRKSSSSFFCCSRKFIIKRAKFEIHLRESQERVRLGFGANFQKGPRILYEIIITTRATRKIPLIGKCDSQSKPLHICSLILCVRFPLSSLPHSRSCSRFPRL